MAGRKAKLSFTIDEAGLKRMLNRFGPDSLADVQADFPDVQEIYLEKMIELAPLDTGELENSGRTLGVRNSKRGSQGGVRFDTPYAAIVHEMPRTWRGERTREKQGNEFGPAGPKFMERVLRGLKMGRLLAERLRAAWARRG